MKKNSVLKNRFLVSLIVIGLVLTGFSFFIQPVGAYPIFGYSTVYASTQNADNYIVGEFKVCANTGKAKSIMVYTAQTGGIACKYKCALYEYTDNSSSYAGNLIASTEEKSISSATPSWYEFNFSVMPSVISGTNYYFFAWAEDKTGYARLYYTAVAREVYVAATYTGTFPATLTGESVVNYRCSMYVKVNDYPTLSGVDPTNASTGNMLTPRCSITIGDTSDTMTVYFSENSTGSWVIRQTNTSCANGTYRWTDSYASNYDTWYWWRVSANDGVNGNTTAIYKFKTGSASNWAPVTVPYPNDLASNVAQKVRLSLTVSDDNGDDMNITWSTNESGSWVTIGTNSSVANGTYYYMFDDCYCQNKKYYWKTVVNDGMGGWNNDTWSFTTRHETAVFSGVGSDVVNESIATITPSGLNNTLTTIVGYGARYGYMSSGSIALRLYFYNLLKSYGYWCRNFSWTHIASTTVHGINVLATKNGTYDSSYGKITFSAHLDTVSSSPGADDDGSGVAAMIQIANAIQHLSFNRTIEFILMDGEEFGCFGSNMSTISFTENNTVILCHIDLDTIGYAASSTDFQNRRMYSNNVISTWVYTIINAARSYYGGFNESITYSVQTGYHTDADEFWNKYYDEIHVFEYTLNPYIHAATDVISHINFNYLCDGTRMICAGLMSIAQLRYTRPMNLDANVYGETRIDITWRDGIDSDSTLLRGKMGSYPSSFIDGTELYNGSAEYYMHTGLYAAADWYYRAWSWNDTEGWSFGYDQDWDSSEGESEPPEENETNVTTNVSAVVLAVFEAGSNPATIFFIIWILLACSILFGKNVYQWFIAAIGILILGVAGASLLDSEIYAIFMVATTFMAGIGFVKVLNWVMSDKE